MQSLVDEREITFLLYEFLDTEELLERSRYADHSRHVFDSTLDAARRIASDFFAPHNALGDQCEPSFEAGRASVIPETANAWRQFAEAGFLRAHWEETEGGLQLPEVVLRAALALFFAANVASSGYPFLTIGAANLLRSFGTDQQKRCFLEALGNGRFSGTMSLTEPAQGSALGDIKTVAVPQNDGTYRLFGQKIFISGGDQNFTENIVHMVLARIEGAPAGASGVSLFIVPKRLVNDDGSLGEHNDVALAGLLHKMGWRNTTSTVLSFGERDGAIGFLLGQVNRGLAHMFQMMNEARIGVGLIASCLAYRGFVESLNYVRERPQGRMPSQKDPLSPQVRLIEHADVRRLLLAQKAFAEGSLAMCLFASALFEDQHTHPESAERARASLLLDLLTPVVKSWPAKYGCASNDMAIQLLGGAGYTRDYPVEQLYRDQRLNPIHEGAEAIHGLDLLGRKVSVKNKEGLYLFQKTVGNDIQRLEGDSELASLAQALKTALNRLVEVTETLLALAIDEPDLALANSTVYLDAFGRITAAWMWLRQAEAAQRAKDRSAMELDTAYYAGKIHTAKYFFEWELPVVTQQFALLATSNRLPFDMKEEWFQ